ncbi:hypothetical protein DFH27DRAFT_544127, partial [Peziza echinospora]
MRACRAASAWTAGWVGGCAASGLRVSVRGHSLAAARAPPGPALQPQGLRPGRGRAIAAAARGIRARRRAHAHTSSCMRCGGGGVCGLAGEGRRASVCLSRRAPPAPQQRAARR